MIETDERAAAAAAQLGLLARRVCDHIEQRAPDLIVPLLPSGALVWEAAAAHWAATRAAPLPRVAPAYLGGKAVYTGAMEYEPDYPRAEVAGEFMAGLLRMRPHWPAALAAQLGVTLGDETVRSVLLVDDCIGHGDDLLAAGSLLLAVLPRAEVDLLVGLDGGWHVALAAAALAAQHPDVAAQMGQNWSEDRQAFWAPHDAPWEPAGAWGWLLAGVAGVEGSPFAIRSLTAADCDRPYLQRYLPAAAWLRLVERARAEALRQALAVAADDGQPARQERRGWYGMGQEERFYALAWGAPSFTVEELAERSGLAAERVAELLPALDLVTQEMAGRTVYTLAQKQGLLDYEGLLAGPLAAEPWVTLRRAVMTPFAVEFAATSAAWGESPVLAIVAEGAGAPVQAQLYGFHPLLDNDDAALMALFGAAVEPERKAALAADQDGEARPEVRTETLDGFSGLHSVAYVQRPATLGFVCDPALNMEEKAEWLALLALASLHGETARTGRDALSYLAQVQAAGIETPLTRAYAAAVRRLAGGAMSS